MNLRQLLERSRELIADPKHWTQGVGARDASGNPIASDAPECVCWCAAGAIYKASSDALDDGYASHYGETKLWVDQMAWKRGFANIESLNDNTDHATVLAVFDEAIASC